MKEAIKREAEVVKERKDTQAVPVVLKAQVHHQLEVWLLLEQTVRKVEAEADQIVLARPHLVIDCHPLELFSINTKSLNYSYRSTQKN